LRDFSNENEVDTNKKFVVQFSGLKIGEHHFEFRLNDEFFEQFEEGEIKEGALNVEVVLRKATSLLEFSFQIEGDVKLPCDRCLDVYDFPIEHTASLFVKFGEERSDPSDVDDIMFLLYNDSEIDLSHHLFEYIHLSLPVKRIPCEMREEGEELCNKETLNRLNKHNAAHLSSQDDPRWDKLKDLLN